MLPRCRTAWACGWPCLTTPATSSPPSPSVRGWTPCWSCWSGRGTRSSATPTASSSRSTWKRRSSRRCSLSRRSITRRSSPWWPTCPSPPCGGTFSSPSTALSATCRRRASSSPRILRSWSRRSWGRSWSSGSRVPRSPPWWSPWAPAAPFTPTPTAATATARPTPSGCGTPPAPETPSAPAWPSA